MSVIVKGMKMPKNCGSCWLSKMRGSSLGGILDCKIIGTVGAAVEDPYDILNKRHQNCPLTELPKSHGRLIDADEMINEWDGCTYDGSVTLLLETRPTVIEAEGEK